MSGLTLEEKLIYSAESYHPRVAHQRLVALVGEAETKAIEERRTAWQKKWGK